MANLIKPEHGNTKLECPLRTEKEKTQKIEEDFITVKNQDESTRTDKEDNFRQEATLYSMTQISESYGVSAKTISKRNNFPVKSKISEQKRKRQASCDKNLTDCINTHKRSKTEFFKIGDEDISTFIKQNDKSSDSSLDINSPAGQKEQKNSQLNGICSEFQKFHAENQGIQKNLEKISLISKQSTGKIKTNTNISQNENKSNKASCAHGSKENISFSIDYILAMPGPSRPLENIPQVNFSEQIVDNATMLIEKATGKEKVASKSLSCNLKYTSRNGALFCNICNVFYSEIGLHQVEQSCDVCFNIFQCLRQLEYHYLGHQEYHETFCRICKRNIDEHICKGVRRVTYKCCNINCQYETCHRSDFKTHLYTHSILRIFNCKWCGKIYRTKKSLRMHLQTHSNCKNM